MTILEFWYATSASSRTALICASLACALNLSSYAGLGMSWGGGVFSVLHLLVMALGFLLFARLEIHRRLSGVARGAPPGSTPLPRRLIWIAAASVSYFLVVFFGLISYGEGTAELRNGREVWVIGDSIVRTLTPGSVVEFDARVLRVFSAIWLFFALLIALVGHVVEQRVRWYRAAARDSAI